MLVKQLLTGGGDYEKSLKQRRWAAVGLLAIGLVGIACYVLLVPDSELSDYAQGFYLGAAVGITIGALILLAKTQYLISHPQAQRKARIKETDERQMHIVRTAAQFAGVLTFFVTTAAMFVVLPLSMAAFQALMAVMVLYAASFYLSNLWLSKKAVSRRLELTVTPELAGIKVDTLLKKHLGLSGTVVRRVKWLEDGILVDGVRVNTRFCPAEGQVLSVRLSDPVRSSGIVPTPGPLDIVYEDEDLIVLNKDPGVSVHPGPGHYDDTLGNYLVYYYEKTGQEADFHPVHRLDRGTSGLLVAAKHPHAQERLKQQLHTEQFRRVYLAVCEGVPEPDCGWWTPPLGPKPGSLMEQMVRPDGKSARTRYSVLQVWGGRALVSLELETGRTHQIRVHMAHIGHPLTGDFLYGTEDKNLIARPALHSGYLSFFHPITGGKRTFSVPLPEDMARLGQKNEKP